MKKQAATSRPGEQLLSRRALANRWQVSTETVKRRDGELKPLRFNSRFLRYRLSDVQKFEEKL
jgi:DNA-binding transcriptional MocR family regulator